MSKKRNVYKKNKEKLSAFIKEEEKKVEIQKKNKDERIGG
jgi:hypothetical protein